MYKKNRIKEMIDNGQVPLGMQCFTEDPARSWHKGYAARKEELELRSAPKPTSIFDREKWPEPLNFFEVETFSRLKPKQSNTERN